MTTYETLKAEKASIISIGVCILLSILAALVKDLWPLAVIATAICGVPIVKEVVNDARNRMISAEALVLAALIACLILQEFIAAAEVAIIMAIGELLEHVVTTNARSGIEALGKIKMSRARVIEGENVYNLPLEDVRVGRHIRIYPGEVIPLDGIIIQGSTSVDKSIMTGESIPVDVGVGDEVFSGTCNLHGSIDVEVTRDDSEGLLNRMTKLLENADARKSKIVGTADRWAKYILVVAVILTVGTYIVTEDVYRALTIMVVFCPCAFVLATPAGIMAAAGNMARNGVLLKDASAIEGMNKMDMILFDKTGTLTTGVIHSLGFTNVSSNMPAEKVEGLVASLESRSEHPLGMAISADHEHIGTVEDFLNIPGKGTVGTVDGIRIAAGNTELMSTEAPEGLETVRSMTEGLPFTMVYIGMDGKCVGYFRLEDTIKERSLPTIKELGEEGLKTVMLTGDNRIVAQRVADNLGIDLVVWDCRPETKLSSVEELERTGRTCMIGDGMNDAPSLRRATVGISMGVMGNDVSVESSDIVFVDDDISKIPGLYRLCKRTVRTIVAGLILAMSINIAGTVLAMLGMIGPVIGAILHNGGSIIVILLATSVLWAETWAPRHKGKNQ